jgi:uncharacterized protein
LDYVSLGFSKSGLLREANSMSNHPIVHVEFSSRDLAESQKFYAEVFGWKTQAVPELDYAMFQAPGGPGGGFTRSGDQVAPGATLVYIQTHDLEASLAKIESLGGRLVQPKTQIPGVGWFALFRDPSNNLVALFTGLVHTKAALMAGIDENWRALNQVLDQLGEAGLAADQDSQGWTVKDHIGHVAAWERSARYFLEGKPRHEALGVDEALFREGDDDKINAAIREQQRHRSAADLLAELRQEHRQLMALLEPMSDDDLQKPLRHFDPNVRSAAADRPVLDLIYGNTADHFREHHRWIEAITGREA